MAKHDRRGDHEARRKKLADGRDKVRARAATPNLGDQVEGAVDRELTRSFELLRDGHPEKAEHVLRRALERTPDHAKLLANLVNALDRQGRHSDALAVARRAVARHPEVPQSLANLAALLKFEGALDEALALYRRAVALAPEYVEAWRGLGSLKRFEDPADQELASMRALLAGLEPADVGRVPLSFAVAKALEETGDLDGAWLHYERGNRIKRSQLAYDPAEFARVFDEAFTDYDGVDMTGEPSTGATDAAPILVVGMPRSGTTLVEHILASHPAVAGVGECGELHALTRALREDAPTRPRGLAELAPADVARLGRVYAERLRRRGGDASRIVDKTLNSHLYTGLVARGLPRARFVHVAREPLDNIVACFRVLFTSNLPYTYELTELAQAYVAVNRLARRWRERLPDRFHELSYERLVADQEGETRRLLEFLGLPWSDRCLDFARTERRVDSASSTQVRRPLYTSAVGAWRKFERHLPRPLVAQLTLPHRA
jgi:tetratricopeptide (TPR) repeat protein